MQVKDKQSNVSLISTRSNDLVAYPIPPEIACLNKNREKRLLGKIQDLHDHDYTAWGPVCREGFGVKHVVGHHVRPIAQKCCHLVS